MSSVGVRSDAPAAKTTSAAPGARRRGDQFRPWPGFFFHPHRGNAFTQQCEWVKLSRGGHPSGVVVKGVRQCC